jgi:putative MATE family efflux protein
MALRPEPGDESSAVAARSAALRSGSTLPLDPYDGAAPVAPTGASLVHDPIARVVWRVGVPAVASNLLMIVFSVVDAFWVGRRLGAVALAAVTTSLFWIWLFISIAEMIGVGLTAVAARRHGEGRPGEAALAVGDALLYALGLGLAVAAAGTIALPALFAAMHTPAEVTALGKIYLGTYLLGAPGIFCYFAVDAAFRAQGDTRTPLLLLASSVAITLVLDPVLILGLAGAPRLGLVGAAIATVSVRGAACVAGVGLLVRRGMVRFAHFGSRALRALATISRIGAPTALTGVLFSLIYVIITRTASQFGTPALAAMGLGFRVESWIYVIGVGFGAAAAAIVGQNLGAGDIGRAERAGWITVAFATAPASLAAAVELLFPQQLAGFFTHERPLILETAHYLRIAALSQLCVGAEVVFEGAMGGAGDTVPPMVWSTTCTAARIPLASWSAARWGTGGLWTIIAATAALRGLGMAALWRIGWWKRKVV